MRFTKLFFLIALSFNILFSGEYSFSHYSPGTEYAAIALADYNGDGVADVWAGSWTTNNIEIWSYDQLNDSLIIIDQITGIPSNIHDIVVRDMDGDGDLDVVAALRNSGTYYCENTGSAWSVKNIDGTYGWQVQTADFNLDGKTDILASTDWGYLKIFYGDGAGNFVQGIAPSSAVAFGDSKGMNILDVNGDNRPDIMGMAAEWQSSGTNDYFLRVYLNSADADSFNWNSSIGPVSSMAHLPVTVQSSFPSAGDLNGDGIADQVAYSSNGEVIFYSGSKISENFSWAAETLATMTGGLAECSALDIDADGNLDIIVGGGSNFNDLYLFKGDGLGHFSIDTLKLGFGAGRLHSIKAGDIDGNGSVDLIFAKYEGGSDGFMIGYSSAVPMNPAILSVTDVPDDQGGWVYLDIIPSPGELSGAIDQYNVLSLNPDSSWVIVGGFAAMNGDLSPYLYLAPTFADSTISNGTYLSSFKVIARSSDGKNRYESKVESGFSLDNIAPQTPDNLEYTSGDNEIALNWSQPVDEDFQYFEVWRNDTLITYTVASELTDNPQTEENTYMIYAVDYAGNKSEPLSSPLITLGIDDENQPVTYALLQNYPNPFNPTTTIKYQLPEAANVVLSISNTLGQRVRMLVNSAQNKGHQSVTWDGKNDAGESLPSGLYFYHIRAGKYNKTMKMMLLK